MYLLMNQRGQYLRHGANPGPLGVECVRFSSYREAFNMRLLLPCAGWRVVEV